MTLDVQPPEDLETEAEEEAFERGALAGAQWLRHVMMSLDLEGEDRDAPALDPSVQDDGECPECGGEIGHGLGEQDECRRCGYRP